VDYKRNLLPEKLQNWSATSMTSARTLLALPSSAAEPSNDVSLATARVFRVVTLHHRKMLFWVIGRKTGYRLKKAEKRVCKSVEQAEHHERVPHWS